MDEKKQGIFGSENQTNPKGEDVKKIQEDNLKNQEEDDDDKGAVILPIQEGQEEDEDDDDKGAVILPIQEGQEEDDEDDDDAGAVLLIKDDPEKEEEEEENKKKTVLLVIIILLLVSILIVASGLLYKEYTSKDTGPSKTAVIRENEEVELTDPSEGSIRVKINPYVQIQDGTMQNLMFCNYNKDRLLKCKIKVGSTYVYDSGYLSEGNILVGDFIDTSVLKAGENEAIAEIYSYTVDYEKVGQTNVKMTLTMK
jgi:hypothetical protein